MRTTIAVVMSLTILLFAINSLAEDLIVFNTWSRNDGFIYESYVEYSRLMKMPDWSPERGLPPISSVKAIEIASKYLLDNEPTYKDAKVAMVQLTQFLIPNYYKDKWYYNVVFMNNIPVTKAIPDNTSVVVLMDGSIADVSKQKIEVDKDLLKKVRDNLDKKINE